jgi:hypothetical protein
VIRERPEPFVELGEGMETAVVAIVLIVYLAGVGIGVLVVSDSRLRDRIGQRCNGREPSYAHWYRE